MSNLEKYNHIFTEVFGVEPSVLDDKFSKDTVDLWDSVHQLNLISLLEETFNLILDPEDIIGFTTYKAGKDILVLQGIAL